MARHFTVILLGSLVIGAAALADGTRVVRAPQFVSPDGELLENGLIVIRDGKIAQVGGQPPAGAETDEYDAAVLSPGLIDVASALGAFGNLTENQAAIQPAAIASDAFDRFAPQLAAALRSGVTAFALCPDDQNLIGGRIAICHTGGPGGRGGLIADDGPMKLSLSPETYKPDREPTSRAGALRLLRAVIEQSRAAKPPGDNPVSLVAAGRLPAVVSAPAGADAIAAAEMAEDYGLRLTIQHSRDALDVAPELARRKLSVIVGPLSWNTSRREAAAAAVYEKAGLSVSIAGGSPLYAADSVRFGAALAARHGLSAAAARRAITSAAAAALGLGDRLGALKSGLAADLVVFSGDPIDLRSRVLAVYIDGQRVYVAPGDDW